MPCRIRFIQESRFAPLALAFTAGAEEAEPAWRAYNPRVVDSAVEFTGTHGPEEEHMSTMSRIARVPRWGTLLILLAATWAAGCGVSKSKYMDATNRGDELAAKNQQLQTSLDAATKSNEQLKTDQASLDAKVKDLETTNQQLSAKVEEQQKANEQVRSTYESLVGNLKGEVSSGKMEIQQMRDGISVNLAQDILFKSGSAQLDKTGKELLTKVSDQLKGSSFQVLVMGHTDNQKIGPGLAARYPTNWELGGARAACIVRLFEDLGIPKERLAAVSFADSRPREPNDKPEGRAKNRRIEIRLRPTESAQESPTP
jgi:chemotaxis protein MotB